jgi:hypothetical protein
MGFNFFNADDIFEMAAQIERNGARFYRQAAEGMARTPTLVNSWLISPAWKMSMKRFSPP